MTKQADSKPLSAEDTLFAKEPKTLRWSEIFAVCVVSVALTVVFWKDLWTGGGLIGGDLYSYFMPQKSFMAEQLHQGNIPLWNNLVGHGYPIIAESQTGVLYPINLVLYTLASRAPYTCDSKG